MTIASKSMGFSILLAVASSSIASASQSISAHDECIQVLGTHYVTRAETGLQFQRHREDVLGMPPKELGINPSKARNTSGIVLAFQTDSTTLAARFQILEANYMGSAFGVFENGELIEEYKFNRKTTEAELEFTSKSTGTSLFEIALPSFANVEFQGLEIDDGAKMTKTPTLDHRVYVALGDSISHGVGQDGATHKTWPFLLSRKLNAEVFNLAVGGGKISVPIADMLSDWEQIDLITILIGYNDLHFDGKTPEIYGQKYNELLDAIRANHPKTKVCCITPLYTKKPVSAKTGHTVEQFRATLSELVKERQATDKNLYLIDGDKITSEKNLRADNPKDPVHLGIEGASLLADELAHIIGE
jgi:lysophospholipase L1-like esterase